MLKKKEFEEFAYHFFDKNLALLERLVLDGLGPGVKIIPVDVLAETLLSGRQTTPGHSTVLLRSVTTSGVRCVNFARDQGLERCEIISVIDRGLGAREFVESAGFSFRVIMKVNL